MKKLVKILFSTLLVALMMVSAVACGISDDWREVRDNLKDAHFEVETASTDKIIEASLKEFGLNYTADAEDIECMMIAASADEEFIVIVFCKETDIAKDIYDFVDENIDELEEEFDLEDLDDFEYDRNGTVVYLGTKGAIDAAQGK